ncbi:hypothetical protein LguiB_018773 [Lonicera macranthoides]
MTSNVVAPLLSETIAKEPHMAAKHIVRKFKEFYGVKFSYWNAWYGRDVARVDLHDDNEHSYKILVQHCKLFMKVKPGSLYIKSILQGGSLYDASLDSESTISPKSQFTFIFTSGTRLIMDAVLDGGCTGKAKAINKMRALATLCQLYGSMVTRWQPLKGHRVDLRHFAWER